jgi:hypothetical protein
VKTIHGPQFLERLVMRKTIIATCYFDNISPRIVELHRQVIERYAPENTLSSNDKLLVKTLPVPAGIRASLYLHRTAVSRSWSNNKMSCSASNTLALNSSHTMPSCNPAVNPRTSSRLRTRSDCVRSLLRRCGCRNVCSASSCRTVECIPCHTSCPGSGWCSAIF